MSLSPTITEQLARARSDMRMGLPVVGVLGDSAAMFVPAETLTRDRLADFRGIGQPLITITSWRAKTLKAQCYDGDIARYRVPSDAQIAWIDAVADPADDLSVPMKGPFSAVRDGKAGLLRSAIALTKDARLLPSVVSVELPDAEGFSASHGLTMIDFDAVAAGEDAHVLHEIISARVPLAASENSRLHVFRPQDGGEEHYALEIGRPTRDKPILARLHSACFTGDLLGSLKCDCGAQLQAAMAQMASEGAGILLYLNQEGRGIGLANKMRAYSLQDQGFDTVEANHRLGFEDDERDFRIGSAILTEMGFNAVRLITNNPAKVEMMAANGIAVVDRVPIKVGINPLNQGYLDTKAKKSGHIL